MFGEVDEQANQQLLNVPSKLEQEVTIHLFAESSECLFCSDGSSLVNRLAAPSEKTKVIPHEAFQEKGKNPGADNALPQSWCMVRRIH